MKTTLVVVAALWAISVVPCHAKSDPPLFVSPDFNPASIDRVDVFVIDPSHDAANNSECIVGAEVGGVNGGGAQISLAKRGYDKGGRHPDTRFYPAPITPSDTMLSNPSKDWLQTLADQKYYNRKAKEVPPPGRWIMIITIDELGSGENAVKGLGRASLSMYLYDRDQGTLLWHDQAIKEHVWGGLLGNVMMKGATKQQECGMLVFTMIKKLPKHPK
jgi:hypothetical protein